MVHSNLEMRHEFICGGEYVTSAECSKKAVVVYHVQYHHISDFVKDKKNKTEHVSLE